MTLLNVDIGKNGKLKKVTRKVIFYGDKGKSNVLLETYAVYNQKDESWNLTVTDKVKLSALLLKRQVIHNSTDKQVVLMSVANAARIALYDRNLVRSVKAFITTYSALVGVYSVGGLTMEIMSDGLKVE